MASPAVAATNESSTDTVGTNHIVALPAGIAAGDLLIILMDIGTTAATLNAHADWTELLDENLAHGLKILYRWAVGGETNPTLVTSATTRDASITYRITGAENPATQAPQIGTTTTGTSTTPNPPAVTPTGGSKDYLAIAFFGRNGEEADDDTWVTAAPSTPSAFSGLLQKACGIAGASLGGMISSAHLQFTASTIDPGTFTCATGVWRAQTVVVHPGAAPPAPTVKRLPALGVG